MTQKNVLCARDIMAKGHVVIILPIHYGYCKNSSGVSCIDRWILESEKITGEALAWNFDGPDKRVVVKTLGDQKEALLAMHKCGEKHIELVNFLLKISKKNGR